MMNASIVIEGFVPQKVYDKAKNLLEAPRIKWRKAKRNKHLRSLRVTQCYRLLWNNVSNVLLLIDHKHYNYYMKNRGGH